MLVRALNLEITSGAVSGFTDVPKRGEAYVKVLRDAKIVNGKTDTHFAAYQNITRGEMALILSRGYKLSGDGAQIPYKDVADRYKDAVAALHKHEITLGKNATTFGTHDDVTRGEFALFLYRLSKLNTEGAIDLSVLDKGLLDGSISIDKLLNDPKLLRLTLLPGNGLSVGDVVKLGTDDFSLLTVTLTEDDLNRGFVDLELKTDLLKTLTGGQALDLVANVVGGSEQILASVSETIELPVFPLVEPVIDLTKNTLDDFAYILAGEKALQVDIKAEGFEQVKSGDTLKLTISVNGKTETVTRGIAKADINQGYVAYTFKDTDLVGRLLESLTTGTDIVITPEITDGVTTSTGAPASYEVTAGLVESLVELLVGLLGSVLSGDVLEGVTDEALAGVLDGLTTDVLAGVVAGGSLGDVLGTVLGGDLLGGDIIGGLLGGSILEGDVIGGLIGGDLLSVVGDLLDSLGL